VLCCYLFPFFEEIIPDSLEDRQYESSSLFESDSELDETSSYVRPKRQASSEPKPKTSSGIIFTSKIKNFVLMHKQNQKESASDESLKNLPHCIDKLVKLENSPRNIIIFFKDTSKYVELLFDYSNRSKANL
jgi:hypothetical protein